MGWRHPEMSLDDLMLLIKGFIDILILANGCQSSGLPAVWDAPNIKNAVRWGLFFQDVFRRIIDSSHYEDSLKELDAALRDLKSDPSFPLGLIHLSSTSLSKARDMVIEYFVQTFPLGANHLAALLTAIAELDVNDPTRTYNANLNVYTDRLMSQMESVNLDSMVQGNFVNSIAVSTTSSSNVSHVARARYCNPDMPGSKDCNFSDHSCFLIHEILKRQASISCTSSAETGLNSILKLVTREHMVVPENNSLEGKPLTGNSRECVLSELFLWSQWRSRCLSYLADKRTIKMLSGAKLIFSSPKVQWLLVFEPLKVLPDSNSDHLLEIMEVSLLGFISCRWTNLIGQFMSQFCDYRPISEQYCVLHCLLQENAQCTRSKMESLSSKEKDILGYVTMLLDSQYHKLWLLPPVLVAAAIPSWSILFKAFWNEIEKWFVGVSSDIRCYECGQDGKEHRDCEVAERIRCLYAFHIQDLI